MKRFTAVTFVFFFSVMWANAWIYPEHRYIALLAIERLNPQQRAVLDLLWADARAGYAERLTDAIIEPNQGLKPKRLDYASWAGIAGDHSCSPHDMLNAVLRSSWIMKVAAIAAKLEKDIAESKTKSKHVNAIRNSDIRLQRADSEYASRAGANNVHFLLSRPKVDTEASVYREECLSVGAELNAIGAYSWFHLSALRKAMRYAQGDLSKAEKSAVILAAFADEAFAIHFLEDSFAAGHTAGTWGAASVRKGTHDYYNERGLEIVTWDGKRVIVKGDAYMTPEDALFAASAVEKSFSQLIHAATSPTSMIPSPDLSAPLNQPDTFNVCKNTLMPKMEFSGSGIDTVLVKTPVPGLATGNGELPRFRTELGMFIGVSTGVNTFAVNSGFGADQKEVGGVGGLEANIRVGLGLDGVLNQAGDGLVFLQAGVRQDASSTNQFKDGYSSIPAGAVSAAIPGRTGYNFRIRMPFWLIPGDLVLAAPILLLVSPRTLTSMAVVAGNGGVIPWQSGIASPIGRFQFILGREVGVSIYGSSTPREDTMVISTVPGPVLVQYSSTKFDFPILEYRPFRTFSLNQSSMVVMQLTGGFDIPNSPSVVAPIGEPTPALKTIWHLGLRILFDWRQYF